MKNLFAALIALLLPYLAMAQLSVTGKVTDAQSTHALAGATVTVNSSNISTASDVNGYYTIPNLQPGSYTISVTFIGYQKQVRNLAITANGRLDFALNIGNVLTDEVTVNGTRASKNSPIAFTNLNKADIAQNNSGRGFEYLLEGTPSAVVTSNAGAGIGYTSIRIRGSDATRINVTLNGIPMNDAEDQGVYFVDLPDLASSVDNIQVQRGVGTSTNGAGAFGASINVQTTTRNDTSYAEIDNSAGSYGTVKNTVSLGTGLLDNHFTFDGRLSQINSNGYIDRAFSRLKSFFLTSAYYGTTTSIRLNVFSGYEQTYQAWDGVPEDSVKYGNRRYNELGYIDATNSFYKNQTDNYTQNYYQLLVNQKITDKLSFSGALHYTKGYGYYEEYRNADSLKAYNIAPVTIGGTMLETTDLVRRLWLNNDFYGTTYNLNYKPNNNVNATLGGAYNIYKGAHYNNIEWTQQSTDIPPDYQYSRDDALKTDFNIFARTDVRAGKFLFYGDLQYRHIYYSFLGFDQDLHNVQQSVELNFFNPKAGVTYDLGSNSNVYVSVAVGHHEPNRSDYTESSPDSRPKPEELTDFELGYRTRKSIFSGGLNGFYMHYNNQLVLTGSLDDVGEAIRTNVKDSYRAGIEGDGHLQILPVLRWDVTAAVSTNKVKNFNQFLYNNDTGDLDEFQYKKTNLAYSPDFVGSSTISFQAIKNGEIAFISRYVSRQYLDNTSTESRSLDGYFVSDVRLNYHFSFKGVKNVGVGVLVNNVFSKKYQSDGATYPYIQDGKVVDTNYWYPQAPANFLATLSLRF